MLWGPTGSGKTRQVREAHPDLYNVMLPSRRGGAVWFDGYCNHDVVLFDDFYGQIPLALFLQLTDRYPMRVQVKGSTTAWRPSKIFITSNHHPDQWWTEDGDHTSVEQRAAFMRRVKEVKHVVHVSVEDGGPPRITRVNAMAGGGCGGP